MITVAASDVIVSSAMSSTLVILSSLNEVVLVAFITNTPSQVMLSPSMANAPAVIVIAATEALACVTVSTDWSCAPSVVSKRTTGVAAVAF